MILDTPGLVDSIKDVVTILNPTLCLTLIQARQVILDTPGLVDAIKDVLVTSESPRTREAAKGALWTLGEAGGEGGRWAQMDPDEREPAHQGGS